MSMQKRYMGEFLSRKSVRWRVEIWQESQSAYPAVGELSFPAGNPLQIEWMDTAKSSVICGSTATLTVISPGDRTYYDLYSIEPGQIRMDVYREGDLYWSGAMDPEHAGEPYSTAAGYDVTLYFSDFGILHRLPYNLSGRQTLLAILQDALTRAKLNYTAIDQAYISTVYNRAAATLNKFAVASENYFDEEGKAEKMYDVLEGTLLPLALRVVQRAGKIWVYDINGLCAKTATQIEWGSTDQELGVDRVYNNVSVSFNPYVDTDPFPSFEYTSQCSPELDNLTKNDPTSTLGVECYTYFPDYSSAGDWDYSNESFTIFLSDEAKGLASKYANAKYFRTLPLLGGVDSEGVALWFYAGHSSLAAGDVSRKCSSTFPGDGVEVLRTIRVYLPQLSTDDAAKYLIRVSEDILLDARYNPFTDASDGNEKGNYVDLVLNFVATLPVRVQLYDGSGNIVAHYTNKTARESTDSSRLYIGQTLGSWASGAASDDDCRFYYYPDTSGGLIFNGWVGNRQAMNVGLANPSASVKALANGQYMPYPAQGGYLEISVKAGIELFNFAQLLKWATGADFHDCTQLSDMDTVRWMLFGAPEIELVKSDLLASRIDTDEVEYQGTLNPAAEESLELSELAGTMADPSPLARALLADAATGAVISSLTRAGRTARPEELLIGTMFSQYAERKDVLTGTAELDEDSLNVLADAALSGRKLLALAETQNVWADETIIRAVEITADEYTTSSNE